MALQKLTPKNIEKMFEDMFEESFIPSNWMRLPRFKRLKDLEDFNPSVDMYDKKDEIVVKAEVPGMKKEDVKVSVTDDVLTIKGEMKKQEEVKKEDYYCSERSFGSFSRVLNLPAKVKADKIKAKFENGLLEIHMPKADGSKPKEVKISL